MSEKLDQMECWMLKHVSTWILESGLTLETDIF